MATEGNGVTVEERIEQKLDLVKAGATAISDNIGGVMFQNMAEVMEFAKLLSLAGTAVPKHLRGKPGSCLAVTIQALEWRMSPVAVANKSYEVNDRIAYESQLLHAVVEARAPLTKRLRAKYEGEGPKLKCTVSGHFKGEVDPLEYTSPEVGNIKVKNSPLWTADPQQQLWYYSVRAWARRYCPDVLLGIYTEDELSEDNMRDITPKPDVGERLKGGKGKRGFQADNVAAIEHKPETPLNAVSSERQEPEKVVLATTLPADEIQMELGAGDVETEIADKKRAIDKVETKAEFDHIVSGVQAFLRTYKRPDLLPDFLSYADKRGKRLKETA